MSWEQIVDTKMNQGFKGHAEQVDYTFTLWGPDIPYFISLLITNAHIKELEKENSSLLELKVWQDTTPTWQTDYYVRVIATASPLFWNIIIGGVLLLLIGIAVYFSIKETKDIIEYIGETAPGTLPILAIAAVGVVGLGLVIASKRKS